MRFRADHPRLKSFFAFVTLAALACGSPGELGDGFPPYEQTGYDDGAGGAPVGVAGTVGLPQAGTGGGQPQAGTGGGVSQGGTGSVTAGTGGGAPVAGTGGGAPGGAGPGGAGGGAPTGGCPDDITVLFNRPGTQGGCGDVGCHTPGGLPPDLVSPDPASRLLNVLTTNCNARPYIGATDSFLAEKIDGSDPQCGEPMPFFLVNNLSDADRTCILDWIDEVAASGG